MHYIKATIKRAAYALACITLLLGNANILQAVKASAESLEGSVFDLAGDDEVSSGKVSFGFSFDFYGTTYTDAWVATNGSLQFGPSTTSATGTSVPSSLDNFIAPLWDDLYTNHYDAKSIYYKTVGEPGSRKFILQWSDMNFCCNDNAIFGNLQVILYEGTNTIRMQYFGLIDNNQAKGSSGVIGIQKDSSTYNIFSDNTASLNTPTDAIEYTPDGSGGYTDNGHRVTYDEMELYSTDVPAIPSTEFPTPDSTEDYVDDHFFGWDSVDGATNYILAYGSDPLMQSISTLETAANSAVIGGFDPDTDYYWRVSAFKDGMYSYSPIRHFHTTADSSHSPVIATAEGPANMIDGSVVDPTKLLSKPFQFTLTDSDTSQNVRYEFKISNSSDPADAAVIDYLSGLGGQGNRTFAYGRQSGGVYLAGSPSTHLDDGTTYYIFARAINAHGATGPFSSATNSFVYTATAADDDDGTTAATEDAAPNSGDANNDGVLDSWEDNVTSFTNPVTNTYSVLEVNGENIGDCKASSASVASESSLSSADNSYSYPAGLMNFTASCLNPGATMKVTQIFYGTYPSGMMLRKYNPNTKTYTDIPGVMGGSTTIGGQAAMKFEYFVTDGGTLDQDGSANGTIVDPSGPAVLASSVSSPNTGLQHTDSGSVYTLLSIGVLLSAAAGIRKRKA